jgi:acyl transferase domain-containing protein
VAPVLLPKQGGALPAAEAQETSTWGVSAFAFQGTNAHAVLSAVSGRSSLAAVQLEQLPAWQGKRQYVLPEAHLLITAATVSAAGASRRVLFHAELAAASLAFLWDHQVMGKGIFPGEASAA